MATYLHLKYINDHFKAYKSRLKRESVANLPLRMRLADEKSEYGNIGVLAAPPSPFNTGRRDPQHAECRVNNRGEGGASPVRMEEIRRRVGTPGSIAMHQSVASAGTLSMLDVGFPSARGQHSERARTGTSRQPAITQAITEEGTGRRSSDTSPRRNAPLQSGLQKHSNSTSALPLATQHISPTSGNRLYDEQDEATAATAINTAQSPPTNKVPRTNPLHSTQSFSAKGKRVRRVSTLQQMLTADSSEEHDGTDLQAEQAAAKAASVADVADETVLNPRDVGDKNKATAMAGGDGDSQLLVVKLRRFQELDLPPLSVAHIIYNASLHMLSLNPYAATISDQFYEIPLHLALRVSNAPSSVIYALLDAYPLGWLIPNKNGLRLLTELISYEHQGGDAVAHALDARDVLNEFQLRDLQRYLTDVTSTKKSRVDAVTLAVAVFGRKHAMWSRSARKVNLLSAVSRSSNKSPRLEHQAEFREKHHGSPIARIGILADTMHRQNTMSKSVECDREPNPASHRSARVGESPLHREVTAPKRAGGGSVLPQTPESATAAPVQDSHAVDSPV